MRIGRPAVLAILAACAGGEPPAEAPGPPPPPTAELPADSLVLRTVGGVEVWFVGGRPARDSAGAACFERSLEIRDSAGRRGVPLLYTLEAPVAIDDSTVRARVYNGCRAADAYRVSLRTGRPTPVSRR